MTATAPTLATPQAKFIEQNVIHLLAEATAITAAYARLQQDALDKSAQLRSGNAELVDWAMEIGRRSATLTTAVADLIRSGIGGLHALCGPGGNWFLSVYNGQPLTDEQMTQIRADIDAVTSAKEAAGAWLTTYRDIPPPLTTQELIARLEDFAK